MGETFNKQFSEGFIKDIHELLQACIEYKANAVTVTIDSEEDTSIYVRMEFTVYKGAREKDGCSDGISDNDLGKTKS